MKNLMDVGEYLLPGPIRKENRWEAIATNHYATTPNTDNRREMMIMPKRQESVSGIVCSPRKSKSGETPPHSNSNLPAWQLRILTHQRDSGCNSFNSGCNSGASSEAIQKIDKRDTPMTDTNNDHRFISLNEYMAGYQSSTVTKKPSVVSGSKLDEWFKHSDKSIVTFSSDVDESCHKSLDTTYCSTSPTIDDYSISETETATECETISDTDISETSSEPEPQDRNSARRVTGIHDSPANANASPTTANHNHENKDEDNNIPPSEKVGKEELGSSRWGPKKLDRAPSVPLSRSTVALRSRSNFVVSKEESADSYGLLHDLYAAKRVRVVKYCAPSSRFTAVDSDTKAVSLSHNPDASASTAASKVVATYNTVTKETKTGAAKKSLHNRVPANSNEEATATGTGAISISTLAQTSPPKTFEEKRRAYLNNCAGDSEEQPTHTQKSLWGFDWGFDSADTSASVDASASADASASPPPPGVIPFGDCSSRDTEEPLRSGPPPPVPIPFGDCSSRDAVSEELEDWYLDSDGSTISCPRRPKKWMTKKNVEKNMEVDVEKSPRALKIHMYRQNAGRERQRRSHSLSRYGPLRDCSSVDAEEPEYSDESDGSTSHLRRPKKWMTKTNVEKNMEKDVEKSPTALKKMRSRRRIRNNARPHRRCHSDSIPSAWAMAASA